jgi:hypothetical protein
VVLQPWAPSYQLWTLTTYGMITIQKHPRFRLKGTPMFTFDHIPVPYHFRRALSPYMVQEMLMTLNSPTLRQLSWTIEGPLLLSQILLASGSLHHSHRVPSHHLPSSLDTLKDQVSDLPFRKHSKRPSAQL